MRSKNKSAEDKYIKLESLEGKKYDINQVSKPWSITSDGKVLSRNVIYFGDVLPEFLMGVKDGIRHSLTRPDGTVVDNTIRQKVKKTIIDELVRNGYKYKVGGTKLKCTVTRIENIAVRIKNIKDKGYAIIIDKRKSAYIDRDTIKIRKYLKEKGIEVKDELICPTYCIKSKRRNIK